MSGQASEVLVRLVEAFEKATINEERSSRNASMSRDYPREWRAEHIEAHEKSSTALLSAIAALEQERDALRAAVEVALAEIEPAIAHADARGKPGMHHNGAPPTLTGTTSGAMQELRRIAKVLRTALAGEPAKEKA